jgi:hypothetical protein
MATVKFQSVAQALEFVGLSYVTEHKFHPSRHWRFDYALPELGIAIEYEGLYSKKSRHTTIRGYREDCRKYNEAALLGWVLIRITNDMLKSGEILTYLNQIES